MTNSELAITTLKSDCGVIIDSSTKVPTQCLKIVKKKQVKD